MNNDVCIVRAKKLTTVTTKKTTKKQPFLPLMAVATLTYIFPVLSGMNQTKQTNKQIGFFFKININIFFFFGRTLGAGVLGCNYEKKDLTQKQTIYRDLHNTTIVLLYI